MWPRLITLWLALSGEAPRKGGSHRRPAFRRPLIEALEDRCLLSAGALDPTFGSGGIVTAPLGAQYGTWSGDLLQSNGDIILYGGGLARFTSSGSLDPSFGRGGIVQLPKIGKKTTVLPIYQAALQADGKIVTVDNTELVRYNSNGTLDQSFGSTGVVSLPAGFSMLSLLIQPSNGDIVVGGAYYPPTNPSNGGFALLRYTPSGTLDSTFGSGGEVVVTTGPLLGNSIQALALENGDIVASGTCFSPGQWSFDLVRFTPSGSLDTTFGSGGIVTTPLPFDNNVYNELPARGSLLVQPNGQIVSVGTEAATSTGPAEWMLARYNTDGSLDSTFGSGGIVTSNMTPNGDFAFGAALESNGQIVVVGQGGPLVGPNWNPDGALLEVGVYNPNGSLDTSFGSGGFVTQAYGTGAGAGGVVIQPDGKIVVAGTANFNGSATSPGTDKLMLARYGPSAAQIGSFTAGPNPVTAGSSVTLTASNITLADPNSTITHVAFYLDSNGDGVLEPGSDTLLGTGTQTSPGVWTLNYTASLAAGSYTLFAQAQDSDGVLGDPVALTLTVQ
jgi:uncharacterized delta-60 repeat protein